MEVEAKFAVPNRQVYRSLLHLRDIAGYAIVSTASAQVADRYFDTADGQLLAAGYACRLRSEGASVLATLKGLGGADGAVHQRDEQEVQLPAWTPNVTAWPASPARDLAVRLTAGAILQPLFDLAQHRTRADVLDGARRVAELSLDAVRVAVGQRPALYYELEIELKADGTAADLAQIAQALHTIHGLLPEPRSKFARALETLQRRGTAVEGQLSPAERQVLAAHVAGPDVELARRATVVLAWADGLPTREIMARSGLSDGRVRFWLRAFRARRMGIFAGEGAEERRNRGAQAQGSERAEKVRRTPVARPGGAAKPALASPVAPTSRPITPPPPTPAPARPRHALPTITEFCRSHGADLAHARFVGEQAADLFDRLRAAHRLPRKRRRLIRQAALLLAVGAAADPERPHRAGRDLVLAQPLHDISTGDRLMLACIVALQRRKPKPENEPAMAALETKQREHVVTLAALLHIAEALDFSHTQATQFQSVEGPESARCDLLLAGPGAEVDARQAEDHAGWWQQLTKQTLAFTAVPVLLPSQPATGAVGAGPPPRPRPARPHRPRQPCPRSKSRRCARMSR